MKKAFRKIQLYKSDKYIYYQKKPKRKICETSWRAQ